MAKYFNNNDNKDYEYHPFFSLRQNDDLYDDAKNIVNKVLRIRCIQLSDESINWEILDGNKVTHIVYGIKFTKKQQNFLKTPDGMRELLAAYKNGDRAVVKLKQRLKKAMQ